MRRPPWLTRSNVLWGTGIALGLGMAIALVAALATGTLKAGIGAGTTTVTSKKIDSQGKVIETTITTTPQDAKTLWDWLNLMGVLAVPITLAGLGALLQLKDQRRAKEQANLERKIADKNRQEDVLQYYQDRVSYLLIEKNLPAIAAEDSPTTEQTALLKESVKSIQTLTLSTLRQLSGGGHKASVVWLLIKSDIIQLLGVSLSSANLKGAWLNDAKLSNANLEGANLEGAYLEGAVLRHADLIRANLREAKLQCADLIDADLDFTDLEGADLRSANLEGAYLEGAALRNTKLGGANLSRADISEANLSGANLEGTYLKGADLSRANLEGADLSRAKGLTKEQLEEAYLCKTTLPKEIGIAPDRDCGKPYDEWFSEKIILALEKFLPNQRL
jgi:uncharacterized protein YjbI with pentapeptide repeats